MLVLAGRTPGLAWELQQCRNTVDPRRFLIIVPNDRPTYEQFSSVAEGAGLRLPNPPAAGEREGVGGWRGIVRFDENWQPAFSSFRLPVGKEYEGWEYFFKSAVPTLRLQSTLHEPAAAVGLTMPAIGPYSKPGRSGMVGVHRVLRTLTYVMMALFLLFMFFKYSNR